MTDTYTLFLKELADHLTSYDVETIKFLLPNDFPPGLAENLNNSKTLLSAMDQAKLISKNDIDKLYFLLENIPRKDLISKLDNFKATILSKLIKVTEKTPQENCIEELHPMSSENVDTDDDDISIPIDSKEGISKDIPPIDCGLKNPTPPQNFKLMTPDDFRPKINPLDLKQVNIPKYHNEPNHPPKTDRQKSSHQIRPEEYSMKNNPHGNCIIFSNRFDKSVQLDKDRVLNSRIGTEKDVTLLTKTFEWLGFKVTVYRNQAGGDIIKTLTGIANQKGQENIDCFICCILSHGFDGGFYGDDGKMVYMSELIKIFGGDYCPSLINKPKLFFIQACQGENDGRGVRLQADGPECVFMQDHLGETSSGEDHSGLVYQDIISTDADFLFLTSSTPGTISWRDQEGGSWFVQSLCSVFQEKAYSWSLMDMILNVNDIIALKKEPMPTGLAKQMSNLNSTMRKKLYFFPDSDFEIGAQEKGNVGL